MVDGNWGSVISRWFKKILVINAGYNYFSTIFFFVDFYGTFHLVKGSSNYGANVSLLDTCYPISCFILYFWRLEGSELQNRQSSRETTDDAFRVVFGKEQPGRVRCYGRSVTTSSLKKDEEITKLKQKHANEIASLKEEMKEMMREEMRCFFSQLVKNNPGLDFHDIQGCVGCNIPSPVDVSSARAMRDKNLQHSSGSTHAPSIEKENTGDAIRNGGHKSI
uniref:Uncharacterized protein LOC104240777 n=1 Tax=Nicotiana sylvestris TaxID=4096 RepID=A0A1U7Y5A0_NICSY|nr:PREDICTED: uncharacterized protein LOC104240777 [Nicotiana sylvestris]